jgi:two-component system, LytTR family, sensor kinase
VPAAFSLPFFGLKVLVNVAFGASFAPAVTAPWGRVQVLGTLGNLPIYWLLLGVGAALQLVRDHQSNAMRAIRLERSLADAQLDVMKMKLQPDFLFNTLNAMRSLAQEGETAAVVRVVERLGTLLRLSMERSAPQFVTLEEELELLDAYLAIQQVRFGERLHVIRRIEPDARGALVPNLILQPLVENALVHGLSRRLDASVLEIAAHRDGVRLRIAIRDDGPGLPDDWSLAVHARAGLKNVSDRVARLFPETGRFEMVNGATGGAVALLTVPFADAATTAVAEIA